MIQRIFFLEVPLKVHGKQITVQLMKRSISSPNVLICSRILGIAYTNRTETIPIVMRNTLQIEHLYIEVIMERKIKGK